MSSLEDINVHPITGYGLDSFRHILPGKKFSYVYPTREGDKIFLNGWDNPHNFLISLWYEWGILGPILFFGYLTMLFNMFRYSIKTPNMLGLAGAAIAVLIVCTAHFPMFLARTVVFVIPLFAMFECEAKGDYKEVV